jgi:hypothetical protein
MKQFAVADAAVALSLNQERYQQTMEDFGADAGDTDTNWMTRLKLSPRDGRPDKCSYNVLLLLENDPQLKDRLKKDTFADRVYGVAPLPWGARKTAGGDFAWCDEDDAGLRSTWTKYSASGHGTSSHDALWITWPGTRITRRGLPAGADVGRKPSWTHCLSIIWGRRYALYARCDAQGVYRRGRPGDGPRRLNTTHADPTGTQASAKAPCCGNGPAVVFRQPENI